MLLCTVRACRLPLAREGRRMVCPSGHSFDIARSGYINLLQPQDRRSKHPGDSAAAAAARRRLHERGYTQPIVASIASLVRASPSDVVLDAGCGEGFFLGSLAQVGFAGHGVDISIPAIELAARRYPKLTWVVANADRELPYGAASFSLVLSITARMNPPEFRRVLRSQGRLLVAVPAPNDIAEIRGASRDLVPRTVEEFAPFFTLVEQSRTFSSANLDTAAVNDVLLASYRPLRPVPPQAMRLTFALDLLLFRPR